MQCKWHCFWNSTLLTRMRRIRHCNGIDESERWKKPSPVDDTQLHKTDYYPYLNKNKVFCMFYN